MQVSVDTMNTVYATPSLRGPAAQMAFKLHAEAAGEIHDSQAVADTEQQQRKKQKLEPEKQVQLSEQKQILTQMQELMSKKQQQQYTMQQQMLHQSMMQRHKYGMAPVDVLQDQPLQPAVLAVATAVKPAPYGRALSTLRHQHQ
jgi:hypothetical protein